MRNPPRGFTLLELLAASALAAVLMIAVAGVIAAIGRAESAAANAADRSETIGRSHVDAIVRLVRRDLAHAWSVDVGDEGFAMVGHAALAPGTLEPTHRPARIVYRLRSAGGRAWLVREQRELAARSNRRGRRQLVASGIRGFRLRVLAHGGGRDDGVDARSPAHAASPAAGAENPDSAGEAMPWSGRAILELTPTGSERRIDTLLLTR